MRAEGSRGVGTDAQHHRVKGTLDNHNYGATHPLAQYNPDGQPEDGRSRGRR
jgi:hypothetical protein